MRANTAQIGKVAHRTQQMILWDMLFQRKLVEQSRLCIVGGLIFEVVAQSSLVKNLATELVAITLLRDLPQTFFATAGLIEWGQSEPGRQIAPGPELFCITDRCDNR